jgi:hypothetical protein
MTVTRDPETQPERIVRLATNLVDAYDFDRVGDPVVNTETTDDEHIIIVRVSRPRKEQGA